MARFGHQPDPNPTRARARARRNLSLVLGWGGALLLILWLSSGGPAVALLPLGVIAVLVVSDTIQVVRGDGPETHALAPCALAEAVSDDTRVEVPATRAPDHRERGRRRGTLAFDRGHLSFTVDPSHTVRRSQRSDELSSVRLFDVAPRAITLHAPPTWRHPQLILRIDGVVHIIEFTMPGDLAAGMIGSVCAKEWFAQLQALGATIG